MNDVIVAVKRTHKKMLNYKWILFFVSNKECISTKVLAKAAWFRCDAVNV